MHGIRTKCDALAIPLCGLWLKKAKKYRKAWLIYVKSDYDTGNDVQCRKKPTCGRIMQNYEAGWIPGISF